MKKYRKKPVVVEAVQFDRDGMNAVALWCGGFLGYKPKPSDPDDVAYWLDIPTLDGVMRADLGDYIIKGADGRVYSCKPDIFAATFEEVAP